MIPKKDRFKIPRRDPEKRPAAERVGDFKEIYKVYTPEQAIEQANRCILCKHEPCVKACPVQNHIPQWLEMCADGKFIEAATLSHSTSNMPDICGRICPQDRLCEKDCVIGIKGDPVAIGAVEVFINEYAFAQGFRPPRPEISDAATRKTAKVAVVGSGPAGLSCAEQLSRLGHQVTVFDSYPTPGGLLVYGIPGFKLDKAVVERRITWLKEAGVQFVCSTPIGPERPLQSLFDEGFAAVFLGIGAMQAKAHGLPIRGAIESDLKGVSPAIPFLIRNNLQTPTDNLRGKRVVVLGGGDTSMDCVRTAVRCRADKVTLVYRRDEENMPGSRREVRSAREEGVEFCFLTQPTEIVTADQQITGVACVTMALGEPDSKGRRAPTMVADSHHVIPADLVIVAFGFDNQPITAENSPLAREISLDERGRYRVDENQMTSVSGVFAGGDSSRGADLVVTAIAEGRKAADGIDRYLQARAK